VVTCSPWTTSLLYRAAVAEGLRGRTALLLVPNAERLRTVAPAVRFAGCAPTALRSALQHVQIRYVTGGATDLADFLARIQVTCAASPPGAIIVDQLDAMLPVCACVRACVCAVSTLTVLCRS
jgi:hypothetical protein